MIYLVSDPHFGHSKIISYCNRPFNNVHEMDQYILDQINLVVKEKDILYFLGDFCHKNKSPLDYRDKVKCKKVHLILGNHDLIHHKKNLFDESFESVDFVKEIIYCNQKIFMSHYCHKVWPSSHKGSFMCYGHTHSKFDKDDKKANLKVLDVGVDNCINYNKPFGQPFSFKEIQNIMFKMRPQN